MNITQTIAAELNATAAQVEAAVALLDEGATVPFIARYRKEATGGLDDSQLRTLEERLGYLRELMARKETVLKSIEEQGKLTPELIARQAWGFGSEHRAQPLVVSISQTTECGTCYTAEEIRAIADYAHSLGMKLHMDGARIANAAAYLDTDLRSISSDAGVDLLSFGGTKNGLLFGECLVALSPDAVAGMAHLRKINLQLASKMRFISAQFIALLEHDLWLENARHSNRMAVKLAEGLQQIEGVQLLHPVQSNAVFARLPEGVADKARAQFAFYDWDQSGTVRLMCSFDTQPAHVDTLLDIIRKACA